MHGGALESLGSMEGVQALVRRWEKAGHREEATHQDGAEAGVWINAG
jgi:hypothetical protein